MARKRVTLAQVAAEAEVAVSTASLVLSGRGTDMRISEKAQARVRDAAARLGYRPNAVSVGLRKGSTSTLAFVSDSVASSRLAGEMIKGAIEAARDRGYMVFVGETGGNVTLERQLLDAMVDRQVDGIILASMLTHGRSLPTGLDSTPAVLLNISIDGDPGIPVVVPDELQAGRDAATALVSAGLTDIHLIGAGPGLRDVRTISTAAHLRLQGILEVLSAHGLAPASGRAINQWLPPEGFRAADAILASGTPEAIVCFNDRLAMGVYQAIQSRGLSIPDDVSVVSFDDSSIAAWMRPGLTTVALPHRVMGKRAADLLVDAIEHDRAHPDEPGPTGVHLVPMPLRERDSIRARPGRD
ncbi:LacI family DNA-binding transcriptional regulator [Demequina sp. NBRC 110053]|uniref:LacI family DNA-binding transcriptional regulator n=1 Tax=Demequina sp. NBRC 110053 TaxID=1570342 RepID=UPI00118671A0|nr:LacI family DNA-binding transcriptional regulator [Demequina sp. NBRC 110053]